MLKAVYLHKGVTAMLIKSKKRTAVTVGFVVFIISAIFCVGWFGINLIHQGEKDSRTVKVISAESANQIAEKIIEKTGIADISRLKNEQISKYYGVPKGTINTSVVYQSHSTTEINEIAVFKIQDRVSSQIVTTAIEGRLSECRNAYSALNEKESKKIENCLIESSGEYIILVICDDTESANEAISEFYQ